ncbi:uncharacterized protein SPPG_05480 [Spizellomyces punctatus DAOM BR117]|uniref:Ketoreductase domain-containing protein n=1 Tax=Spizellomyces punctatus (strain DAOM BR117) TaxID=645134 RepID=A0A0L0HE25_SPIPD|nr:uncharacterized protein SPPG_05480 [Spizellomyces punctatus DAOM BR117]KNC99224.1 hypothetical protein SPPG_05480 [Spizellomyces punctatus DAOM BR117]|eukprot:XP_016607264.1 hypothetical protein SPPG_05480 [Spizellomyces punctatus DAOM BR117]
MENVYNFISVTVSPVLFMLNLACKVQRRLKARPWPLENKVVLITGASSGIGEEIAYEYARHGARIVLAARREQELQRVELKCRELGAKEVLSVPTDVGDEAQVANLIQKTREAFSSQLDALYVNAGLSMGEPFEAFQDLSVFRTLMEVNYFGCISVTHQALPLLKQTPQSRIVVTSSVAGLAGIPSRTGYCATKFAVRGFYEALQSELYDQGVFVTLVYPGAVVTNINATRLGSGPADLDMKGAMTAETCAKLMVKATKQGRKELVMTHKFKLGRMWEGMVPDLWALLVRRGAKKAFKEKSQ